MTLAHLGLDLPLAEMAAQSAFFRRTPQPSTFWVSPSPPFIGELQRCWEDPRAILHLPSDCRALAAIQDTGSYGLDHMPNIDPAITSRIVSSDEALRSDKRCPRHQWWIMDELWNSRSHGLHWEFPLPSYVGPVSNAAGVSNARPVFTEPLTMLLYLCQVSLADWCPCWHELGTDMASSVPLVRNL